MQILLEKYASFVMKRPVEIAVITFTAPLVAQAIERSGVFQDRPVLQKGISFSGGLLLGIGAAQAAYRLDGPLQVISLLPLIAALWAIRNAPKERTVPTPPAPASAPPARAASRSPSPSPSPAASRSASPSPTASSPAASRSPSPSPAASRSASPSPTASSPAASRPASPAPAASAAEADAVAPEAGDAKPDFREKLEDLKRNGIPKVCTKDELLHLKKGRLGLLIVAILEKELGGVGIFRLSGSKPKIDELYKNIALPEGQCFHKHAYAKHKIELAGDPTEEDTKALLLSMCSMADRDVLTSVLKQVVGEMYPNILGEIKKDLLTLFQSASGSGSFVTLGNPVDEAHSAAAPPPADAKVENLKGHIQSLSQENQVVLKVLIRLLAKAKQAQDEKGREGTKMDEGTLATCIAPRLYIPAATPSESVRELGPMNRAVEYMMIHHESLFPPGE